MNIKVMKEIESPASDHLVVVSENYGLRVMSRVEINGRAGTVVGLLNLDSDRMRTLCASVGFGPCFWQIAAIKYED